MRLPVEHAGPAPHCVLQGHRVEVEKLLQLFEFRHAVAFVGRPQHHRSVGSRPCPHRGLPSEPPLAQALGLDPSLTFRPLLLRVRDIWACCFVQIHLPAFFHFTLSSLSVSPVFCEPVPQNMHAQSNPGRPPTWSRKLCV